MAAEDIFGPNLGSYKGKTVQHKGVHVRSDNLGIPTKIMTRYQAVTLCIDIMYVNKIAFLVSLSRHIKFGTVEVLKNRKAASIIKALKNIHAVYHKQGFTLTTCLGDGKFEPLRGDIARLGMELNTASNDEQIPDMEQYIRTIKERTRSVYNTLPFDRRIPARMVAEMVHASVFWLNTFPLADGVSSTLSPRALITGQSADYAAHCKLEFGEYVQCDEEHDNTMQTRTTGAIALRPTGNLQGGYYFFSLSSGRRLDRKSWTTLPVAQDVIHRVHALARRLHAQRALLFTDSEGYAFADDDDDDDDSDYDPADAPHTDSDDDADDDDYSYDDADDADNDDDDNVETGDPAPIAGVDEDDSTNGDQANDDNNDDDDANDANNDDDVANDVNNDHNDANTIDDDDTSNNDDKTNNDYDYDEGGISAAADSTPTTTNCGNQLEHPDEAQPPAPPADDDHKCALIEPNVITVPPPAPHDKSTGVAEVAGVAGVRGVRSRTENSTGISIADAHEILEKKYGKRTGKHNLRPRKPRSYQHLHGEVEHTALTQQSVKKGYSCTGRPARKPSSRK